jgi:spore germination cell wall hydrolase CwlJ-like protein
MRTTIKYLSAAAVSLLLAFWLMPKADRIEIVSWFDLDPTVEVHPVTQPTVFATTMPKLIPNDVVAELECLTDNLYYEARGESYQGRVAVARVVMERMQDPRFPDTACEVVYQGARYSKEESHKQRGRCQFSWLCDGIRLKKPDPEVWYENWMIAARVYVNNEYQDVVPGALFFHATSVNPRWRYKRVGQIGNHIFYTTQNKG